jgi:hypothetical protein
VDERSASALVNDTWRTVDCLVAHCSLRLCFWFACMARLLARTWSQRLFLSAVRRLLSPWERAVVAARLRWGRGELYSPYAGKYLHWYAVQNPLLTATRLFSFSWAAPFAQPAVTCNASVPMLCKEHLPPEVGCSGLGPRFRIQAAACRGHANSM